MADMPQEIYAWMGHGDNGSWDNKPCVCDTHPSVKYIRADLKTGLDDGPPLPQRAIKSWKQPLVIKAWQEGLTTRALGRIFDISHETAAQWVSGISRGFDARHTYQQSKKHYHCSVCGYPEHELLQHYAKGEE